MFGFVFLDHNLKNKCTDSDPEQCPLWEKEGECQKNPRWMLKNCKKSCKVEECGKSICRNSSLIYIEWSDANKTHSHNSYKLHFIMLQISGIQASNLLQIRYPVQARSLIHTDRPDYHGCIWRLSSTSFVFLAINCRYTVSHEDESYLKHSCKIYNNRLRSFF